MRPRASTSKAAGIGMTTACLALLVPVGPIMAQVSAGAKAGLSVASFAGSSIDRVGWRNGFTGGVFVTSALVQDLSFQAEALYVQKGAKLLASDATTPAGTLRLDYLELPVMLRVDLPIVADRVLLHGMAGPSVAVNLRCALIHAGHGGPRDGCAGAGVNVRSLDWNMVGGGGISLDLGGAALLVEARLHIGLSTIDDRPADLDRTNQTFSLLGGVSVPLSGRPAVAAHR
jgi:hypothetical protein